MIKKDDKKLRLRVGYTVFAGLVLFFFFIIMVGTEGYYFSKTYNLNLLVKSAEGLIEGGNVSLGGLKIGQIDKIEFTTVKNENLVLLKLSVLEKYSSQITNNSYAKIETSGLLGDKLINISLGSPSDKPLKDGDYIPVKESFSLENITNKVEPLITNIMDVVMNLKIQVQVQHYPPFLELVQRLLQQYYLWFHNEFFSLYDQHIPNYIREKFG